MRPITVRPIRFEDCVEGATVFAQKHNDFVMEYEITNVTDSVWDREQYPDMREQFRNGHTHDYRSVHAKDPNFRSEWGFSMVNYDLENPSWSITGNVPWYVEVVCVGDTDGDGNCPFVGCPKCSGGMPEDGHLERRVIEPEGVVVNLQVFIPNAALEPATRDAALLRAMDIAELTWSMGANVEKLGTEIDGMVAQQVSENHVHVFDKDGILVAEDIRSNVSLRYVDNSGNYLFVSAFDVPVVQAQREVIEQLVQEQAQRYAETERIRGRRGKRGVNPQRLVP